MIIIGILASVSAFADSGTARYCAACHSETGNSESVLYPRLAGQASGYLVDQLKAFKAHTRQDPKHSMNAIAASLEDAQIQEVADYFSKQVATANNTTEVDADLVKQGKSIYENGITAKNVMACAACHGADGKGGGAFPVLAGQHASYLVAQLQSFKAGELRKEATTMPALVAGWDLEEAEAIAAYLQSLVK